MKVATKRLGSIVSAILTFIVHKQTNKQTDKPNIYEGGGAAIKSISSQIIKININ